MPPRTKIEILEEELEECVRFRGFLQKKIERLRHEIRYEKNRDDEKPRMNLGYDRSLFIPTNCITPHVYQYLKTHSQSELARSAGVSTTTIQHIVDAVTEFTSDSVADAVFQAMGLPHIYGQLTPVRLKKILKKAQTTEPPPSQYFEE